MHFICTFARGLSNLVKIVMNMGLASAGGLGFAHGMKNGSS